MDLQEFYEHLLMYVPENLPENLLYDATNKSQCLSRKAHLITLVTVTTGFFKRGLLLHLSNHGDLFFHSNGVWSADELGVKARI